MELSEIIINILSILIGYFIGSILPAYFFGRLKGIDIRKEGTCNAGTLNVYHTLGVVYAIPTAIFDTLKGLFVILLTQSIGADYIFAQISGLVAIVGHILPFYIGFRGGQGVGCATGIMLFYLVQYILIGPEIFYFICFLLIIVAIFAYITKTGEIIGIIVLPLLAYSVFIYYPDVPHNIFFCLILAYIISIGIYNIVVFKKIIIEDDTFKSHWWRVALRPFAIFFIVFYICYSKMVALIIIGCVCLVFIFLDIIRFIHKGTNELLTVRIKSLFKKHESKKFSSMTIFLVAVFITILLFEIEIAFAALTFLIFGDIFSKIFGLSFGRHKIFKKTVEGTLAYIGCALICGYIIYTVLEIPLILLILGGITAALTEVLSLRINDNFSVPIISGAVMTAIKLFTL